MTENGNSKIDHLEKQKIVLEVIKSKKLMNILIETMFVCSPIRYHHKYFTRHRLLLAICPDLLDLITSLLVIALSGNRTNFVVNLFIFVHIMLRKYSAKRNHLLV